MKEGRGMRSVQSQFTGRSGALGRKHINPDLPEPLE
jgi:hypothetical protein